jgi:hypothetical protein
LLFTWAAKLSILKEDPSLSISISVNYTVQSWGHFTKIRAQYH